MLMYSRSSLSLTERCAEVIGKRNTKDDLEALADVIPEELQRMCLFYQSAM